MKYLIALPEIWIVQIPVEAESEQEAYEKIHAMIHEGNLPEDKGREFSHIMQNESWSISEDET